MINTWGKEEITKLNYEFRQDGIYDKKTSKKLLTTPWSYDKLYELSLRQQKRILKRSNHMDFTILAVVLLLCGGIPLRNKIYKERKKKKEDKKKGI